MFFASIFFFIFMHFDKTILLSFLLTSKECGGEKLKKNGDLFRKLWDIKFITLFIVTYQEWAAFLFCILNNGILANR